MRLVGSSDPDALRRDGLRWHVEERAVLTSAVCRELKSAGEYFASRGPRAALDLLPRWMSDHGAPRALDAPSIVLLDMGPAQFWAIAQNCQ